MYQRVLNFLTSFWYFDESDGDNQDKRENEKGSVCWGVQ